MSSTYESLARLVESAMDAVKSFNGTNKDVINNTVTGINDKIDKEMKGEFNPKNFDKATDLQLLDDLRDKLFYFIRDDETNEDYIRSSITRSTPGIESKYYPDYKSIYITRELVVRIFYDLKHGIKTGGGGKTRRKRSRKVKKSRRRHQ